MQEPDGSANDDFEAGSAVALPASPLYTCLKVLVAVLLAAMTGITFVDVFLRYLFSAPIPGAFEIVEFMLGLMVFASIPLVTRTKGHITVSLFDSFIRGGFRRVIAGLILAFSLAMMLFIAERMYTAAGDMLEADFVSQFLGVSPSPVVYGLSALSLVTAWVLVGMIREYLRDPEGNS